MPVRPPWENPCLDRTDARGSTGDVRLDAGVPRLAYLAQGHSTTDGARSFPSAVSRRLDPRYRRSRRGQANGAVRRTGRLFPADDGIVVTVATARFPAKSTAIGCVRRRAFARRRTHDASRRPRT